MTVIEALRTATESLHRQLEARLCVGARGATTHDYAAFLAGMYGWLAPLESRIWAAPWPREVEAERRCVKTFWLTTDLVAMGRPLAEVYALPRCADRPDVTDEASRYGLAYVIEGSMLGGKVLLQRLARHHPSAYRPRYLQGYGDDTGLLWRAFLVSLEARSASSPAFAATAARAAQHAFRSLDAWFRSQGLSQ